MADPLRISDVMTTSPIAIDIDANLQQAQLLMKENGIRHLPVTREGKPASLLSDRDIHLAVAANKELQAAESLTVGDVCTLQTYMVEPGASLAEVTGYMAEKQYGSVLIVEDGALAGIFTATDACKQLALLLADS